MNRRIAVALLLAFVCVPLQSQQPAPSRIVLYRSGGLWSRALDFPISVDGRAVGALHNGVYVRVSCEPGLHVITAGGSLLTQGDTAALATAPGAVYYLRIDNIKGMHEHVEIRLIRSSRALRELSSLKELTARQLN